MTSLQILIILNILIGRLIIDHTNYPAKKTILWRLFVSLIFISFLPSVTGIFVLMVLSAILIVIDIYWVKENVKLKHAVFISFVFFLAPAFANELHQILTPLQLNNPLYPPITTAFLKIPLFANLNLQMDLKKFLLILTGYLFTIKESTLIIRALLDTIKAVPQKQMPDIHEKDEDEYNRGKYIGILERTFIYFLVIFNQYTAIGILLGLKTFARFKELDNRDFAEYFLIGSMLSILTAVLPAIYVLILL